MKRGATAHICIYPVQKIERAFPSSLQTLDQPNIFMVAAYVFCRVSATMQKRKLLKPMLERISPSSDHSLVSEILTTPFKLSSAGGKDEG